MHHERWANSNKHLFVRARKFYYSGEIPKGKSEITKSQVISWITVHFKQHCVRRGLVENEVEWSRKTGISKANFLAAGEAQLAIFWPTPDLAQDFSTEEILFSASAIHHYTKPNKLLGYNASTDTGAWSSFEKKRWRKTTLHTKPFALATWPPVSVTYESHNYLRLQLCTQVTEP